MRASSFLTLSAAVVGILGIVIALLPVQIASLFAVPLDPNGALMARYVGVAWLGYALLDWQARSAATETQRIALAANLVPTGTGIVVTLFGIATGVGGVAMWFWVALFAFFAAGDAYFLRMGTPLRATGPARA
jgi:hypothetical protein